MHGNLYWVPSPLTQLLLTSRGARPRAIRISAHGGHLCCARGVRPIASLRPHTREAAYTRGIRRLAEYRECTANLRSSLRMTAASWWLPLAILRYRMWSRDPCSQEQSAARCREKGSKGERLYRRPTRRAFRVVDSCSQWRVWRRRLLHFLWEDVTSEWNASVMSHLL